MAVLQVAGRLAADRQVEGVDRALSQFHPEHASPDRFSETSLWLPYGYQLVAKSGLFERT